MTFTTLKLTRTFDATPKAVYRAFTTLKDGPPVHIRLHYDTIKNQIEKARK